MKSSLWRRNWQPTPILLPGKSHGRRSVAGYSPWGRKESDMTEQLHFTYWKAAFLNQWELCATDTFFFSQPQKTKDVPAVLKNNLGFGEIVLTQTYIQAQILCSNWISQSYYNCYQLFSYFPPCSPIRNLSVCSFLLLCYTRWDAYLMTWEIL